MNHAFSCSDRHYAGAKHKIAVVLSVLFLLAVWPGPLLRPPALLGAEDQAWSSIQGMWHYGLHYSPEYCVEIEQEGKHVQLAYMIVDNRSGERFVYARARGRFVSYYELYFEGEYIRGHKRTPKGARFAGRWLVYDRNRRIQEISHWGVHRITSYLIRDPSSR